MRTPLFIVFEGVDGSGTSTQCERLCARLSHLDRPFIKTREPGGTAIGERIREILLDPKLDTFDDLTELLLYAAARRQHTQEKIVPSLKAGMPVISDRYAESTTAYQGAGRRLPATRVAQLNELATGGLQADLTIVLDLPLENALERRRQRAGDAEEDRLEQAGRALQVAVRAAYLEIAAAAPERTVVIDASGSVDEVEDSVYSTLISRFPVFPFR